MKCSTKLLVATPIAAELKRTLLGGSGEFKPDITPALSSLAQTIGEPRFID